MIQPVEPTTLPEANGAVAHELGYATLARRITGWTSNLLATVIVGIAGLGLGGQIIQWWHEEPDAANMFANEPKMDALNNAFEIQFGDAAMAMTTEQISGDKAAAAAALRKLCLDAQTSAALSPAEPGKGEKAFLASVSAMQPIDARGSRTVYQSKGEVNPHMIVVDRPPVGTPRVVAWGLAIPAPGNDGSTWTVTTFRGTANAADPADSLGEIPLPPGGHRILALRPSGGQPMLGFQGLGRATDWVDFYRQWSADNKSWVVEIDWIQEGGAWHARYAQAKDPARRVDVTIGVDDDGELSGLLLSSRR